MKTRISTADAARNLGEYLARVKHTGARFILVEDRTPIGELGPASESSSGTFAEPWHAMRETRADSGFAEDLERVNATDAVMENPWR